MLLLVGRLVRRRLLLGPQGRWREDLWFADLLAAQDPPGDGAGSGRERPSRPRLTSPLPINTCSEDSLTLLPGVGPRLAARIAASRAADGPFRAPLDLERVKGIGPVLAGRLAPLVRFGPDGAHAAVPDLKSP